MMMYVKNITAKNFSRSKSEFESFRNASAINSLVVISISPTIIFTALLSDIRCAKSIDVIS